MNAAMPSLFLSHGSPMLALEEEPTTRFLRALAAQLPRPEAVIVASAHWETQTPTLTGSAHPETIHDFSGFPEALYAMRYPAPGNPALAARIETLLGNAGIAASIDPTRGLDHGAWNPLCLLYPHADIPVVQLSVQPRRDARWHYAIGQALAPLRQENILILGSGNLTHNLYEAFRGRHRSTPLWVTAFARWISTTLEAQDIEALLEWQSLAPYAKQNHPTPEHFLPFFVALGAAGTLAHAQHLNPETALQVLAMDAYIFA